MNSNNDGSEITPGGVRIGPFILAVTEGQLYRGRERVPLGGRAFALLRALLEAPGHAATRNELVLLVWPGRCVEEANLSVQISALRKALGREAIVTSYGRGYRLTLRVETIGAERRRAANTSVHLLRGNLCDVHVPPTSFVGRGQELAALQTALSSTRLMTLLGAGGIGKTRLALRFASSLSAERIVCFVDVARLQEMEQLDSAVALAFERRHSAALSWRETLPSLIAGQDAVLILDNCEHMAVQCAGLVNELTALCPTLKIVATSRVRLFMPGETLFELAPLALPAFEGATATASSEATDLFIARGGAADIGPSPGNFSDIVSICRSVDGVPLAIELAAAWLPFLSSREIAIRLRRDLRLLDAGPAPPSRHHTMEATIRWSYSMLDSEEQETFRRLSVFSGGCTVEAALGVCGAERDEYRVLRCIARLQEFSLLSKRGRRLSMLQPVSQFAEAELARTGERLLLEQRHLHFFLTLAERYRTSNRAAHLELLEPERDNLRAAQQRSLRSTDSSSRLQMVIALYEYWADTGRTSEAASFAEAALSATPEDADVALLSGVRMVASRYAKDLGNVQRALKHGEQALAMARHTDSVRLSINALDAVAWAQFEMGEQTLALATATESRKAALAAQLPLQTCMAENTLGELHRLAGNFAEAESALQRVLAIARDQRNSSAVSMALLNLGLSRLAQGDFRGLAQLLFESATVGQQCGAHRNLPYLCRTAAALSAHLKNHRCAAMFLSAAESQMQVMQLVPSAEDRRLGEAVRSELAKAVNDVSFAHDPATGAYIEQGALWTELIHWLQLWQGSAHWPQSGLPETSSQPAALTRPSTARPLAVDIASPR